MGDKKLSEMTQKEKLEKCCKLMSIDTSKMKVLVADKFYEHFEDFIHSEELKQVHLGFVSTTSVNDNTFVSSYVVGDELYVVYQTDGINYMKKESVLSCSSSGGLCEVILFGGLGFIVNRNERYDKCEPNRKVWRKQNWKVLTDEF